MTVARRPAALLALAAGGAALAVLGLALPAGAQTIADERRELARALDDARRATARSQALEQQAQAALDDAAVARAREAAVAARIQAAEADIDAAEARVAIVERMRRAQRARLAARQQPIARLTAALQAMARRPAAMAVVQPGSVADMVHVRAMLATLLPVIHARTADLRAEVAEGERLRRLAGQALAGVRAGQQRLVDERAALARLAVAHRRRSQTLRNEATLEADRAIALGEQARDITDLMADLNRQARTREALAALPGPLPRPPRPGAATAMPAVAESALPAGRPSYRLPVNGTVVAGLGEISRAGVRSRGLTIAPRPGAQVVAPAAGRIAFAGAYRGYDRIVIVDHGGGWTSLLTGLDAIAVAIGDSVVQGSPLGRAGARRPRITVELRHDATPIDITRLVG
ncbi:murein hydrolase activator EnvC family protein [Sphingomonas flavalba]|uniref:murein hydrolase activator EnvC family protein n=1 Tax=Sphingomonas flavalba TaxID=2559804 RepID=UPI00109E1D73|nr:peptidoglycan DD-metalloendopeptidase family protein [Sphingomonas flavalba]